MVDEVTYTRTVFSSFADNVIVVRMEADKPKALNFDLSYNSPLKHVVMAKGNELVVCINLSSSNLSSFFPRGYSDISE